MPRTRIGQVTDAERDEILMLNERRNGLKELLLTLDSPDLSRAEREVLERRIAEDSTRTDALFDGWWRRMATKYDLSVAEHGKWAIDFPTKELWHEPSTSQSCPMCTSDDPSDCAAST